MGRCGESSADGMKCSGGSGDGGQILHWGSVGWTEMAKAATVGGQVLPLVELVQYSQDGGVLLELCRWNGGWFK